MNRTLRFVSSQYEGIIPDSKDAPGPYSSSDTSDSEFIENVNSLLTDYINAMEAVKLRLGLQTVMLISMRGNSYLQSSGLNKQLMTDNPIRCAQVISRATNLIYVLSVLIYPFMPATSESILRQLNAPDRTVPSRLSNDILAGHQIGTTSHLFQRIPKELTDVWKVRFGGNEVQQEPTKTKAKKGKKVGVAAPVTDGPKP